MASEKGLAEAMNLYAKMLENGDGVPANREEAIHYYRMSAEKGFPPAQKNLTRILNEKWDVSIYFVHIVLYLDIIFKAAKFTSIGSFINTLY